MAVLEGILKGVGVILPALAVGLVCLYLVQDALLFYPQPLADSQRQRFASHEIRVAHQGVGLHGWFVDGEVSTHRPLLIYYGGNAEEVSYNLAIRERFEGRIGAFLFMNYRGYGASEGRPDAEALRADALYLLDWVTARKGIDAGQVVLMGRSLGTALAVAVASQRPVRRVILVSPFDNLLHLAGYHYPWLPVRLLLRHRFDSVTLAPDISTPALMLIASRDRIIPAEFSLNLARQWGGPVQLETIEGANHNNIDSYGNYWLAINAFLGTERH